MRLTFLTSLIVWTLGAFAIAQNAPVTEDVVFAEDFENYEASRWSTVNSAKTVEIVNAGRRGGRCAQVTATLDQDTGGYLYKMLQPGLDVIYLRYYVKFEAEHGYLHHFTKIMGYNPATRWPQGRAGERPTGADFFSTGLEPFGDWGKLPPPGIWQFYTYHMDMKASRDGKFWGAFFQPQTPAPVERDTWVCVEMMLKVNTPNQADGEQAAWIDGKPIGHWKNLRWRTDPKLNVNGFAIESYVTEQTNRHNKVAEPRKVNRVWFDDIVVSRTYVGPAAK